MKNYFQTVFHSVNKNKWKLGAKDILKNTYGFPYDCPISEHFDFWRTFPLIFGDFFKEINSGKLVPNREGGTFFSP